MRAPGSLIIFHMHREKQEPWFHGTAVAATVTIIYRKEKCKTNTKAGISEDSCTGAMRRPKGALHEHKRPNEHCMSTGEQYKTPIKQPNNLNK